MAKSSTRRVTIYINGKEVEASVKQIRVEMNRLHNGQNRMVVVGDSTTSYRRRRNDVRRRMRGREKMGGGESLSVASDTISAAHLFPLLPRARRTSSARRVASSGASDEHQCVCEDAGPPSRSGLQRKKILLLHRRTIAYEPRPNISPRPPRPRIPSAGRGRFRAPAAPLLTTHC